jgi:hypothetical protein
MERMSRRWICRSRTDGEPTEPALAIVLFHMLAPSDVVLSDVVLSDVVLSDGARMLAAAPDGAPIRVMTQLDAALDALHE